MTAFDGDPAQRAGTRAGPVGRFAGPRILIVGCGDVGRRLVALLGDRWRIDATARSHAAAEGLRRIGVRPLAADLDDPGSLIRLGGVAPVVVHLAPPPTHGAIDTRTLALLRALRGVERLVYVSTTGVYGDCAGAEIDETRPLAPQSDRARRRVDAERRLRAWARATGASVAIVRAPGIYAADRLPLDRIRAATPALRSADDVHTNHIHADDLARAIALAIRRGAPQRAYNAVDDSAIRMGDWFDLVADAYRLQRPPRVGRDEIAGRVPPALMSFLSESRRVSNRRMVEELGVRLRHPTVRDGLAAALRDAG